MSARERERRAAAEAHDEDMAAAIIEVATGLAADATAYWDAGDRSRFSALMVADAVGAVLEVGGDPRLVLAVVPRDLREHAARCGGGPGEPYVVSADPDYAAEQAEREERSREARELAVAYLRGLS